MGLFHFEGAVSNQSGNMGLFYEWGVVNPGSQSWV